MERFNALMMELEAELHDGKCSYNKMLTALSEWLAEDKEATPTQRAKALEIAKERLADIPKVAAKRDRLIEELTKIPYSRLNGHRTDRLAGNVNIGFEFIEGESMLLWLDIAGICCSTGSACSSASLEPSHVLLATGVPHEKAHGSLRLSISHETTDEDIDYIIETLPPIIEKLRNMSPLWEDVVKNQGNN